jgi:hypothetical protein
MNKNFVTGLLLTIFIFSPLSAALADGEKVDNSGSLSSAEQLKQMSVTLVSIGLAVASSTSLNELQRLELMKQLVVISTSILELQKVNPSLSTNFIPVPLQNTSSGELKKDTAKKVGLERVKVTFNEIKNETIIETFYKSSNKNSKTTHNFTELNSVIGFDEKVQLLRDLVTNKISSEKNIKFQDVKDSLFLTARNPIKDTIITPNSVTAFNLAQTFATNSIVNKVEVYPGDNIGTIRILTDQNEWLDLVLEREVDGNGSLLSTYMSTSNFYFPTKFDQVLFGSGGEELKPVPKITEKVTNISKNEIKDEIVMMFSTIPFTSQVPNFNSKLLDFMTSNSIVYNGSSASDIQRDCYSAGDKLVVNEFIKYLVNNLDAQYDDIDKITFYLSPIGQDYFIGCSSSKRFF